MAPTAGAGSVQYHRAVLAIACSVVVFAFAFRAHDGRITLRGFPQLPSPQTCIPQAWLRSGARAAA